MKTKKLSKKLVLSKQTIASVSSDDMNKLKAGGYTDYIPTCAGRTCPQTGFPICCYSGPQYPLSVCICEH